MIIMQDHVLFAFVLGIQVLVIPWHDHMTDISYAVARIRYVNRNLDWFNSIVEGYWEDFI